MYVVFPDEGREILLRFLLMGCSLAVPRVILSTDVIQR